MNDIFGIIIGDNHCTSPRYMIGRASGAHRIATLMRSNNLVVEVIDFFNSWSIEELMIFVDKYEKIDFVGVSLSLGPLDIHKIEIFIEKVKLKFSHVKIIAGGPNVLSNKLSSVDYYFRGFAEGTIDEIIKYLRTGKLNPFAIDVIKTHDTKKVIDCNKHYPALDLKNLKTTYTVNDFIQPAETIALETSRGCVYKCKFCNFPLTGKKKNDYIREKNDIKNQLIENYNNWKTTNYLISDDTFNDNPIKIDMMYEICQELPFKLNFACYARIDLLYSNKDSLKKMVEMGVRAIFVGIESFNPSTSKEIRKVFTGDKLKDYLKSIRLSYPDLHVTGSFILGLPKETHHEMRKNLELCLKDDLLDSILLFPLGIPIDNTINYISPFSKDWQNHGYEEMTVEEVKNFINSSNVYDRFKNVDYEIYSKHLLLWKNENMNFLESEEYAKTIRNELIKDSVITVSAFGCLGLSYSLSLDVTLKEKSANLDWGLLEKEAEKFINNYKKNKLMISINPTTSVTEQVGTISES